MVYPKIISLEKKIEDAVSVSKLKPFFNTNFDTSTLDWNNWPHFNHNHFMRLIYLVNSVSLSSNVFYNELYGFLDQSSIIQVQKEFFSHLSELVKREDWAQNKGSNYLAQISKVKRSTDINLHKIRGVSEQELLSNYLNKNDWFHAFEVASSSDNIDIRQQFLSHYSHVIFDISSPFHTRDLDEDLENGLETDLFALYEPFSDRCYVIEVSRKINDLKDALPRLDILAASHERCDLEDNPEVLLHEQVITIMRVATKGTNENLKGIDEFYLISLLKDFKFLVDMYSQKENPELLPKAKKLLTNIFDHIKSSGKTGVINALISLYKSNLTLDSSLFDITSDIRTFYNLTKDSDIAKYLLELEVYQDYRNSFKLCEDLGHYDFYFELFRKHVLAKDHVFSQISELEQKDSIINRHRIIGTYKEYKHGLQLAQSIDLTNQIQKFQEGIKQLQKCAMVGINSMKNPYDAGKFALQLDLDDLAKQYICDPDMFTLTKELVSIEAIERFMSPDKIHFKERKKQVEQAQILQILRNAHVPVPVVYVADKINGQITMQHLGDNLGAQAIRGSISLDDYKRMTRISINGQKALESFKANINTQSGLSEYIHYYLTPNLLKLGYDSNTVFHNPRKIMPLLEPLIELIYKHGKKFKSKAIDSGPQNFVESIKFVSWEDNIFVVDPYAKDSFTFEDEVKSVVYGPMSPDNLANIRRYHFEYFRDTFTERDIIENDFGDYKIAEAAYRALYSVCRFNESNSRYQEMREFMPQHAIDAIEELLGNQNVSKHYDKSFKKLKKIMSKVKHNYKLAQTTEITIPLFEQV